jgi:hypothetical protein
MPWFGSTLPDGMKRSGCSFSARAETSPADADQAALDAVLVHLVERDVDRVRRAVELLRYVLEHVLDGEVVAVAGLRVLQLLADELVLREVGGRGIRSCNR